MNTIFFWLIIWYAVWIVFNLSVRWKLDRIKNKYAYRAVYFFVTTAVVFANYWNLVAGYFAQISLGLITTFVLGYFLARFKKYYSKFPQDRFFIEFQSINVVFQQTMAIAGITLLKNNFTDSYTNYYFGLLFLCAHILIIFASWSTFRFLVLPLSFLGGVLFSFIAQNFAYGVLLNILLHQFLYVVWLFKVKNERKI